VEQYDCGVSDRRVFRWPSNARHLARAVEASKRYGAREVEKVLRLIRTRRRRGTLLGELKVRCQDSLLNLAFFTRMGPPIWTATRSDERYPKIWAQFEVIRQHRHTRLVCVCSMLPVRRHCDWCLPI
jgi:hypothetical protein